MERRRWPCFTPPGSESVSKTGGNGLTAIPDRTSLRTAHALRTGYCGRVQEGVGRSVMRWPPAPARFTDESAGGERGEVCKRDVARRLLTGCPKSCPKVRTDVCERTRSPGGSLA